MLLPDPVPLLVPLSLLLPLSLPLPVPLPGPVLLPILLPVPLPLLVPLPVPLSLPVLCVSYQTDLKGDERTSLVTELTPKTEYSLTVYAIYPGLIGDSATIITQTRGLQRH